ncbi:(E,E)-alpha-farnesene synthase-like [Malania oleifera]|uniref:(E,E)-alpha-farnesene synthase-like n=1 Tax=Malania oleifera TaxID=397392 RepID=UPI0025ADFED3|nr:(E,E)-alpha-farnesene synthase-like [Malania oleifera]
MGNCAREVQEDPQFVQCKLNEHGAFHATRQRRCANYKPNIWKYDTIQSLSSEYSGETYKRRVEKLKEEVLGLVLDAADQGNNEVVMLELTDSIQKLGLAQLFLKEIKEALHTIALSSNINPRQEKDLYAIALRFRLLRQHGFKVSQDIFNGLVDERGSLTQSAQSNLKGVLELYEASQLAFEGERILNKAKAASTAYLKQILVTNSMEGHEDDHSAMLKQLLSHSLELSMHWRVPWFNVKWQINSFDHSKKYLDLLELAKLNFNVVQATHQANLRDMSRWWRNLGLIENLSFSRDRLVESFAWAVGVASETQYGCLREWLTKVINFVLVIDDVYDVYGSLEELESFTRAVERWDPDEIKQLPACMQTCFQALYNTTVEVAREIHEERGWTNVLPHLTKAWADFCKALFVEAKWYNEEYTPSLQEYLNNGWVSSSGPLLCLHAFLAVTTGSEKSEGELVDFLHKNGDLVYCSSLIVRLCNDLGTSTAELERGDAPSSILCYMREGNASEEKARQHIKDMISSTWRKINEQCMALQSSPLLQPFAGCATNIARVAYCIYQHGDGFGVQDRETKEQILSLFIKPFPLNS